MSPSCLAWLRSHVDVVIKAVCGGMVLPMRKSDLHMNQRKIYRSATAAIVLLSAAAGSSSLTLGKASGAVLLGQPLKLIVPIQLDAGERPSDLCLDAQVFYGDARQDARRVSVRSELLLQTQSANVYVTSSSHVDEPVVTVYFRAGCESKATRRFVLLADLATETATRADPENLVAQSVVPVPKTAQPARPAGGDRIPVLRQVQKRPLPEADLSESLSVNSLPAPRVAPARPRLKLLPVDLTQDRDPLLKSSNELVVGDVEDLQKRADAAALWKSLNATPQYILESDRRRLSMEADLKGLQVSTESNRQALLDLTNRLETAESQRYANPLVYALIAILFISTFGLVYLLFKWKQGGPVTLPWWRTDEASNKSTQPHPSQSNEGIQAPHGAVKATALVVQPTVIAAPLANEAPPLTEVDIDLQFDEPVLPLQHKSDVEVMIRPHGPSVDTASRAAGHLDFAHSMTTSLRAVNTQEMLDVRQQADFFLTLGQHDEALGLLKDCVDGSLDSNPLVYLDLLKALHTLGRKAEFDHYRTDFNAIFSGHVPVYAAFSQGGNGLQAYPEICQGIEAFWPSEQAIAYIEKRLVHDTDDGTQQTMDLEAFRELLMLHGIARRIASSSESGLMPFIAAKTIPSDAGAIYATGSDDFSRHEKTQPVAVADMDFGGLSIDLELPVPSGNLIDFEPSDLSLPDLQQPRKS